MSIIEKALDKLEARTSSNGKKRKVEPLEHDTKPLPQAPAPDADPTHAVQTIDLESVADHGTPASLPPSPPPSRASHEGDPPPTNVNVPLNDPLRGSAQDPHLPQVSQSPVATESPVPELAGSQIEINLDRLSAMGFVVPEASHTAMAQEFRVLKRPLLNKASAHSPDRIPRGNLVVVTSSVPGEGKTFTAVNLAMSIAMELDHRALLVDADAAKSDVSKVLGLRDRAGLMECIAGEPLRLEDVILATNLPKLQVLPSGRFYPNSTELVASEQMRRVFNELSEAWEDCVVVVDAPPLLPTSEARVLARLAGQVLIVVEAVKTPQGAIREALRQIEQLPHVGIVLNKSREARGSGYNYGVYGGA